MYGAMSICTDMCRERNWIPIRIIKEITNGSLDTSAMTPKQLEKIKNKSNVIKEDISKLKENKEEWKISPVEEKEYLFKIVEET